jgi:hypothetical protein
MTGGITLRCEDDPQCIAQKGMIQLLKYPTPVSSFMTMSPVVGRWSDIAKDSGAKWTTRFNHLWMLPKFLLSDPDFIKRNEYLRSNMANMIAEDIEKGKPDVIFVDTVMNDGAHHHVDLPNYLSSYVSFEQAWSHYHFAKKIDYCGSASQNPVIPNGCMFDIYYRN